MPSIYQFIVDLLFPEYCAVCGKFLFGNHFLVACKDCWNEGFKEFTGEKCVICGYPVKFYPGAGKVCGRCIERKRKFSFDGVNYFTFYSGIVSHAIWKLKFRKQKELAKFIANSIKKHFLEYINEVKPHIITYVPLSKERIRERSFDQCEEILKHMGIRFEPVLEKLHTKRQSELGIQERYENIKGSFVSKRKLNGRTVLLFDDVFTTGATLNEASGVLKKAGASKVYCYTVAYTIRQQ